MDEILQIELQHQTDPSQRFAQKKLAEELTRLVHGEEGLRNAVLSTEVLFGKGSLSELENISQEQFDTLVQEIPKGRIRINATQPDWISALSSDSDNLVFPSKTEARKMLQAGAVHINKVKISENASQEWFALREKWLLVQKGKKNYFLLEIIS
jgi:tyrosyl-tRNA synthetase